MRLGEVVLAHPGALGGKVLDLVKIVLPVFWRIPVDLVVGSLGTVGVGSWPRVLVFLGGCNGLKAFAPPKEIFIPVLLLCPEPLKGPCH